MKNLSRKNLFILASASTAAVSTSAATHLLVRDWRASILVGTAVLSTNVATQLGLRSTRRGLARANQALAQNVSALKDRSRDENSVLESSLLDAFEGLKRHISDSVKPPAPKVVKAPADPPTFPAADPNARRSGAPAPSFNNAHLLHQRTVQPITGGEGDLWVKSRTGGSPLSLRDTVPAHRTQKLPFASEIPVAMIADDFTFFSFQKEFKSLRLTPSNWRGIFDKYQPQMFFCESAWQGGDPKVHPWQGKIYASVRWPKENRTALLEILDHCHKKGIPTVFWNKEDPTHFGDRINDFIRTAALFDYVFTTDQNCLDSYKHDVGITHVDVLPFAVQPSMFNPLGSHNADNSATFAGTWYGMYPERCKAAASMMDQVIEAEMDLVIYDRMHASPNPVYRYPSRFEKFVHPAIPYAETANAFKSSRFGITLNTVTDSPTMFARRAFELAASGSVVLSNYADGVYEFFGDSVIYADQQRNVLQDLSESDYRDLQSRALEVALSNTYTHRAETILATAGFDFQKREQRPSGLAFVSSLSEYENALRGFRACDALGELIIVVKSNCEQSLQYKLLMMKDPLVTVIAEDSVMGDEHRVRSFLSSPSVIVSYDDLTWPEAEKVRQLMLHSSYWDGPIKLATATEDKYVPRPLDGIAGVCIPSQVLRRVLSRSSHVEVLSV